MAKEVTLAEVIDLFDSLKQFLESTDKQDPTAIYSQLGELKYKVEKLEAVVNKNPQAYGSFEKRPCTCSCTKSEQPALEWEVWGCAIDVWSIWAGFTSKENAERLMGQLGEEMQLMRFEVRHNPKRK